MFPTGRYQSSWRRRRQSSAYARPCRRRLRTSASRRPRPTYPLCPYGRCAWATRTCSCHRLLGQNSQILGPAAAHPRRQRELPGARLQHRQQEQPPRYRYSGSVYQHRQPRQANRILQNTAIAAEMADASRDMLLRRIWLRSRLNRRPLRDSIRRRQRLFVKLQLQMPPPDTSQQPRHQQRLLRQRHQLPPRTRHLQHRWQ